MKEGEEIKTSKIIIQRIHLLSEASMYSPELI